MTRTIKIAALLVLVLAAALPMAAASDGTTTNGLTNGRAWSFWDEHFKYGYILGYAERAVLGSVTASIKDGKQLANPKDIAGWPDLPYAAIVKALDTFFAVPENLNISISNALEVIADRVNVELSRFLRQPVKTQIPLNGELCHGVVSTNLHA